MLEISKKTKRELRMLAEKAYAKELDQYLLELSIKFDDWKNKKIDCWDLNDHIHKFHNGISRELFKMYNGCNNIVVVSRALARNLLSKDEIPSEVIDIVEHYANNLFE